MGAIEERACQSAPADFEAAMGAAPAGPKAQGRFLEISNLKSGTWKFGIQKVKIPKIKIRYAQNVGNVRMSRKKNPPGPIWGPPRPFLP